MDALLPTALTTIAALGVVAGLFLLLARSWPHSSRRTGYRTLHRGEPTEAPPPVPEDDDAHWNWRARDP